MWISMWLTTRSARGPVDAPADSAGLDLDGDGGAHLGVQAHLDVMRASRLDRVRHLDPAPVELGSPGALHGGGDVGRADRAEQSAVPPGAHLNPDLQLLQLAGGGLGVFEGADLTDGA